MDKKVYPSKLSGDIVIPPSKSMLHRSIICASLSDGVSKIDNVVYSEDIKATIESMEALGARFNLTDTGLIVQGIKYESIKEKIIDTQASSKEKSKRTVINSRESGSTLRFIIPILTLFRGEFEIKTEGKLLERPLKPYFDIFDKEGIEYKIEGKSLFISCEKEIEERVFEIPGNISSQFVSGLLFMLPLLEGESKINIIGEMESKSYIDMTIGCLKEFGVEVQNNDYRSFEVRGSQKYKQKSCYIEGDYSQAAFFAVANALGNNVDILGMEKNSPQGDKEILDIIKNFGADVRFRERDVKRRFFNTEEKESIEKETYLYIREGDRKAYSFDGSNIPDIVPIIALMASVSPGKTVIANISRLRLKESDRLEAVYKELVKLGADIAIEDESLIINGADILKGGVRVSSHNDHRIAMMLSIASTVCKNEITIEDSESVKKSYPNFWEEFGRLGGIYECDMGKEF